MDSDSLFHLKSQFYLGAFTALTSNPLPPASSPDHLPTLLYTARSHIALNNPDAALSLLASSPASTDATPSFRAVKALAEYISGADKETSLEELRDLCIEVEGDEPEFEAMKVAAATAFVLDEELEEALATLGAGTNTKNLECVALIVQIYLSINRVDLARKEYEAAKRIADDALLIQLIEASIGIASGGPASQQALYIYTEQASLPSSAQNSAIITAKGVAHLLRGQVPEADSDFNEAIQVSQGQITADALAGKVVTAELGGKKGEGEKAFVALQTAYPTHPLVTDFLAKSALFDEAAAKFAVVA